jgi:hypothetical protein
LVENVIWPSESAYPKYPKKRKKNALNINNCLVQPTKEASAIGSQIAIHFFFTNPTIVWVIRKRTKGFKNGKSRQKINNALTKWNLKMKNEWPKLIEENVNHFLINDH